LRVAARLPRTLYEVHWVERRHGALESRERARRFGDEAAAARQIAAIRAWPWNELQGVFRAEVIRWEPLEPASLPLSEADAERYRVLGELAREEAR
jgi:hypothetical protein